MVKFTLKQCAYFLAVVEHGGIAQAARALNISQPAVSQALEKLEALYGFQLLSRHHARGTELTPEGRSFVSYARSLIANAELVEHKANSIAAHLAGKIRFGCFHTIAPFYLAQLVKSYRDRHAQVSIVPSELPQEGIISDLEKEKLDLALTYEMGLDAERLDWSVAARLKPFILLSAEHRLATRTSIELADLAHEPFVMFDGSSSREFFRGVLRDQRIDPPVAFNSSTMESVRCAVANGLGFSLSVMRPRHAATYDGGRVVSVPIAEPVETLSLVLAFRKDQATSGLIENFADFCLSSIASQIGSEL